MIMPYHEEEHADTNDGSGPKVSWKTPFLYTDPSDPRPSSTFVSMFLGTVQSEELRGPT